MVVGAARSPQSDTDELRERCDARSEVDTFYGGSAASCATIGFAS